MSKSNFAQKKPLTIVSALAFALSVIHLAYDDFCRLTPDEFAAVCEAYHDHEETLLHDQWERMRLLATITIQPHVKGKVTPERLLPFPWDSSGLGHGNHRAETKKTSPRPVSKEEDRKRFEALMKRMKQ